MSDECSLRDVTLRPHQVTTHQALRDNLKAGHNKQLICAATGSGKTIQSMNLIGHAVAKGKRAMFICDRKTLINQTSCVADSLGLDHGIIQANHPRWKPNEQFQIASVQTLQRRMPKEDLPIKSTVWKLVESMDLIVVDEAHTMNKAWIEIATKLNKPVIGLTATPFTKGLGKIFSKVVSTTTMDELTKSGVLTPMIVYEGRIIDMEGAKKKSDGEWADGEIEQRGIKIVGDVVQSWLTHAQGRKTICFGATILHCERIAHEFKSAGVQARLFTAYTTEEERKDILAEFDDPNGDLMVLVSVDALAKGFDRPYVSCVQLCRPLRKSFSTFIQMIGRGLRSSKATDKTDCIMLDHTGNFDRFADDLSHFYFHGVDSLSKAEKLDAEPRKKKEKKIKECPKCGFSPVGKICIQCGHQAAAQSTDHLHGKMERINPLQQGVIADKRGRVMARDRYDLFCQIAAYVRSSTTAPDKKEFRVRYLYKDMVGQWPNREWSIDTCAEGELTEPTWRRIQKINIASARRKAS